MDHGLDRSIRARLSEPISSSGRPLQFRFRCWCRPRAETGSAHQAPHAPPSIRDYVHRSGISPTPAAPFFAHWMRYRRRVPRVPVRQITRGPAESLRPVAPNRAALRLTVAIPVCALFKTSDLRLEDKACGEANARVRLSGARASNCHSPFLRKPSPGPHDARRKRKEGQPKPSCHAPRLNRDLLPRALAIDITGLLEPWHPLNRWVRRSVYARRSARGPAGPRARSLLALAP